jgi:membrane protein DedA with SNARE-associated domain
VGISRQHLDQADGWFRRYGELTVFIGRLLPVVRTYISFPAGASRMSFKKFLLYTTFGVIPWSILFAWLGIVFKDHWELIHKQLRFLDIVALGAVLGIVGYWWYKKRTTTPVSIEKIDA